MEPTEITRHHILLVGAKTHCMMVLRSVLGLAGIDKITHQQDPRNAIRVLRQEQFGAVFCDWEVEGIDGMSFAIAARRSRGVLNPMLPIFALQERAHRRDVVRARDEGITDVFTVPLSPRTLMRKLAAATKAPRAFIVGASFFGPDRRARADQSFVGKERRVRVARKAKVDFTQA
jgi:two-component system chemotaxis response regulator CheY